MSEYVNFISGIGENVNYITRIYLNSFREVLYESWRKCCRMILSPDTGIKDR